MVLFVCWIIQGYLKQLLILPGTDAAHIACPSSQPSLPDLSNVYPTDSPTGMSFILYLLISEKCNLRAFSHQAGAGAKAKKNQE